MTCSPHYLSLNPPPFTAIHCNTSKMNSFVSLLTVNFGAFWMLCYLELHPKHHITTCIKFISQTVVWEKTSYDQLKDTSLTQ